MMLGLRTTIYKVRDIQKANEWYAKAFEIDPYFKEPYYVGFNIKGYELGLQPDETPSENKVESVVSYWGVETFRRTSMTDSSNWEPRKMKSLIMLEAKL